MQHRRVLTLVVKILLVYYSSSLTTLALCSDTEDPIVIPMPGVSPTEKDEYICYVKKLEVEETYLKRVLTKANKEIVHHASIAFCDVTSEADSVWSCTHMNTSVCTGPSVAVGGWDNFAEKDGDFQFPKDIGIRIGSKTPLKYVVFQVHYRGPLAGPLESGANVTLEVTRTSPKYRYQMFALALRGYIPANKPHGYWAETACVWRGQPGIAYGYVVHTHNYGVMVEGYLIRNKRWILLGSHLTIGKEKRRYGVTGGSMEMRDGDIVAARCLYINNQNRNVTFGHSIDREMCNFMIDFAYDPSKGEVYETAVSCDETSPKFSFCDHPETAGIC